MPKPVLHFLVLVFLVIANRRGEAAQHSPVVLYTDILSGPNSGGENNGGAYISIFGKDLGSPSGLGKVTKVFIGGAEVANYRYLGASMGRHDVQQITVQIGALGNPAAGAALPIEVYVGKVKARSLTPQTFTVNPGRILFVSLTGDDATAAVNDIHHPWRHVQTSESALSGAWGAAKPGDIIVMRGGLWTDVGFGQKGRPYFVKFLNNGGTVPTGTPGTGPIAFTAYPTEQVNVHPPVSVVYGVFDGLQSRRHDAVERSSDSQWITISNLTISTGGINDGPINLETRSDHWRIVNNDLSAPDAVTNRAAGVTGNGTYEVVFGNHIHDVAGTGSRGETLLDHGIYIDSGSDWELAYNLIENITGGSGIQLFNSGGETPTINNVDIHHNWIHDVSKHGLNIGDTSAVGITIWSNVVYSTKAACWRNNSVDLQGARVWNNTFYNCNTDSNYPSSAALMNDANNVRIPITIDFRNNIICPSPASGKYAGGEVGFRADGVRITGNKNLWFGGNGPGSAGFAQQSIFADPKFVDAQGTQPDFHLQPTSPALNLGDVEVFPVVTSDYGAKLVHYRPTTINRGAL